MARPGNAMAWARWSKLAHTSALSRRRLPHDWGDESLANSPGICNWGTADVHVPTWSGPPAGTDGGAVGPLPAGTSTAVRGDAQMPVLCLLVDTIETQAGWGSLSSLQGMLPLPSNMVHLLGTFGCKDAPVPLQHAALAWDTLGTILTSTRIACRGHASSAMPLPEPMPYAVRSTQHHNGRSQKTAAK